MTDLIKKVNNILIQKTHNYKLKKLAEKELAEKVGYNRRNVNRIKRCIVCIALLLVISPIYLVVHTVVKINARANKSETSKEIAMNEVDDKSLSMKSVSNEDLALLDAGNDIDKVANDMEFVGNDADISAYNGKKVYLTFDDGPSNNTEEILDILKEYNVKATFFVISNPDEKLWPMYQRIVDEGHTLAMHSYTHVYKDIYLNQESFENDVETLRQFLYEQTGVWCDFYRFPGGSSNAMTRDVINDYIAYLNKMGITYFDWNSLSEDAVNPGLSPAALNANIMKYVRANNDSIVLMHDINTCDNTVTALPDLLDILLKEGYTLCPIDKNTVPEQHIKYVEEETQDATETTTENVISESENGSITEEVTTEATTEGMTAVMDELSEE